jgi:hypothetical protein
MVEASMYNLELGQLPPSEDLFCPLQAIVKYPYLYVGTGNRDKVCLI